MALATVRVRLASGTATSLCDGLLRPEHMIGLPCPSPFYCSFLNILEHGDHREFIRTEKDQNNQITEKIIGAEINVHRALRPGLLESAYEASLAFKVVECGLNEKLLNDGIRRLVNELLETPRALRSPW